MAASPYGGEMVGVGLLNVTVAVGAGVVVLSDLTLVIARGELLAVLGPSGSGKTTLLRAVAGLVKVQEGSIVIDDHEVTRVSAQQRDVAMAFESDTALPRLDVAGNIGFGLRAHHVPKPETEQRVSDEARRLRLHRLLARKPPTLSAGERARVGIGRALVRVPSVWLLDEPLAHLDPAERLSLRHRLVEQVRQAEVTTIYVTHDPAEALAVADRVAVLRDGRLIQVDTPRAIYRRPADAFVADFVAPTPIGLLRARVVSSAGMGGFAVGARTLPLWSPLPAPLAPLEGSEVVLGIRPEDVTDASSSPDPSLVSLPATVIGCELTGPDLTVTAEIQAPAWHVPGLERGRSLHQQARLRTRLPPRTDIQVGSTIGLAIEVNRAHVFDVTTGAALWHPAEEGD